MKSLYYLFLLYLVFSCSKPQNFPIEFHGQIKSIEETTHLSIEENKIPVKKSIIRKKTYSFGSTGLIENIYTFDRNGKKTAHSFVKAYHKDGQVSNLQTLNEKNELIQDQKNVFDKNNYIVNEIHEGKENKQIDYVNENGRRTSGVLKNSRNIEFRHFYYTYNENGHPTQIDHHLPSGKKTSVENYEYEYDDQKNWTSKSIYIGGTLKEIIERKITYH